MTLADSSAEPGQPVGGRAQFQIRATDLIAQVKQHLGDPAHADSTDTDEVEMLYLKKHFKLVLFRLSRRMSMAFSPCQLLHDVRRPPRGVWMRKSTRPLAHPLQEFRLGAEFADLLKKTPAIHVLIENQPGGPGLVERLGITKLMLICCMWQRNQNGRLSGRGQFRDRARSRPANHQVRAPERPGHVIDEW